MAFGLEGLDAVGRITTIIEKLMNDSGIRDKFAEKGEISGKVRVEGFEIDFTLRRREDA